MPANVQRQTPKAGQESVWDYPRPPRIEPTSKHVRIVFNGVVIADSTHAKRILETSHPPGYYIPAADIRMEYLSPTRQETFCEFKGAASYWTIKVGDKVSDNAAWSYKAPSKGFELITDHLAFYVSRVDECYVGDERVQAQAGDFYGGWITADVVGPFKGEPGTWGW
ncbi:MAG: DUF427 domain-containing protein [Chloroflexota bacterium]|nr:DUF427 domain-containing protein [Chloroflexota bacterium]